MKALLKVSLVLVAIPIVVVVGAFVYGFVAGLADPESFKKDENSPVNQADQKNVAEADFPRLDSSPAGSSSADPAVVTLVLEPLPSDPESFRKWLGAQRFIERSDGVLRSNPDRLELIDMDLALSAYELLDSSGKGSAEDRILWFALCARLPVEERRQFLHETDAILPANYLERSWEYEGDYSRLLHYLGQKFEAPYREAVHLYCEVMSEQDLLDSLRQFRAYEISMDGSDGEWLEYIDEKMSRVDGDTLILFSDKISGSFLNYNKRSVKLALKKLAEKKKSVGG